jgi:hypothetical protein
MGDWTDFDDAARSGSDDEYCQNFQRNGHRNGLCLLIQRGGRLLALVNKPQNRQLGFASGLKRSDVLGAQCHFNP